MARHLRTVVERKHIGTLRKVGSRGGLLTDFRAEAFGLAANVVHHLIGVHAFGIAGKVFHFGGNGELAAGLQAFVNYGVEIGAAGIDSRRVSGRAGAEDKATEGFHSMCIYIIGKKIILNL